MYIPSSAYPSGLYEAIAAPGLELLKDGSSAPSGGWSSLIGIVTAICGNILISFALNTQRYAHIRLSRDRDEWAEKQKAEQRRRRSKPRTYGTQQLEIAEERARENVGDGAGGAAKGDYTLEDPEESNEADPLIPHLGQRKGSGSSDDTVRPKEKESNSPQEKSYLKSPIWWLGISLMTLGEAGNFLAYGFAPASIVSPLGVVALVSNCLIAPLLLHERFRWRDALGVIIAIAGAVTVVLSASDSNPRLTPNKIWHLITRWEFETYLGITVFLIIVLTVASNKYGDRTVLIDLGLVGLFGGYTALSTKGIASLLSNTIWRVVTFPITYLLVAILVFTAVMQIKYLTRALQHFNATIVIPTQFVIFTISVIVGSAILYRDFERQTPEDAAKFFGGCALTFLGVWCITSGRGENAEDDEELGEEEDAIDLVDDEHLQPEIREREDSTARRRSLIPGPSNDLQRLRTADSVTPSVIVTPDFGPIPGEQAPHFALDLSDSQEGLQTMMPANAAAIHSKSMTQLPQEGEAAADPKKPPPLHATTSAPVVPYAADVSSSFRPRTPLNRNKSAYASDSPTQRSPTTPGRQQQQGQYLDPNSSGRLLNRTSVVGLLPGPLMSPLSNSLSAIVADSLRRGVDSQASTMRRRPSRGKSYKRPSSAALKRHSIASGEMDFDDDETANLRAGAGSPQGRVRSLSATLGDLFSSSSAAKRPREESHASIQEQGEERQ